MLSPRRSFWLALLLTAASGAYAADTARPHVIVANRALTPARCEIRTPLPSSIPFALEPGEVATLAIREGSTLQPLQAGEPAIPLTPFGLYVIEDGPGGRGFVTKAMRIPAAVGWRLTPHPGLSPSLAPAIGQAALPARDPSVIRVEIAVDDDEATPQPVWEKRLSQRVAAASQVLDYHAGLKIQVVGARRWTTVQGENDFNRTLSGFETTTPPGKDVDVVLGFTSQFELQRGQFHLGGTRGMLSRHVLLREFSKSMTEMEKLEVLVHELGHYLGAAHSGEASTVMRPVLGDRQSRSKRFRIFFDPLNALAVNIVAAEYRAGVRTRGELSQEARERLLPIYALMSAGDTANDPTTGNMLRCIGAEKAAPTLRPR